MDKTVSQLQLYQYFLRFFLPKGILDFFEPVWMETQSLDSRESKKDILYTGTKKLTLHIRRRRWLTPEGKSFTASTRPSTDALYVRSSRQGMLLQNHSTPR